MSTKFKPAAGPNKPDEEIKGVYFTSIGTDPSELGEQHLISTDVLACSHCPEASFMSSSCAEMGANGLLFEPETNAQGTVGCRLHFIGELPTK